MRSLQISTKGASRSAEQRPISIWKHTASHNPRSSAAAPPITLLGHYSRLRIASHCGRTDGRAELPQRIHRPSGEEGRGRRRTRAPAGRLPTPATQPRHEGKRHRPVTSALGSAGHKSNRWRHSCIVTSSWRKLWRCDVTESAVLLFHKNNENCAKIISTNVNGFCSIRYKLYLLRIHLFTWLT